MKDVWKKLAIPLVACGLIFAGSTASAQVGWGDIVSIHKYPQTGYVEPIEVSGENVTIAMRLFSPYGNFGLQYIGGMSETVASLVYPLEVRVLTGPSSRLAYAKLVSINNLTAQRTELRFQYTVQAGDLAFPMRLFGSAGSSSAGDPFDFNNTGFWRVYNIGTGSNVVWRFTQPINQLGDDQTDPTFELANVRLRTVKFESSAWTVPATKSIPCTVKTDNAVSNNVPFYVWSGNTNIAQIVEQQPGDVSTPLYIPAGSTSTVFHIKGINIGSATIYLSPDATATPGITNYITKTVVVSDPPAPTISIKLPGMDLLGTVTLDESDNPVNALTVELSQTYPENLWVRLDFTPVGQSNITFSASPMYVQVPKNTLASGPVAYSATDGTTASLTTGIRITPALTNAAANTYFSIKEAATVKVLNVKPVVVSPASGSTVKPYTLTAFTFNWEVTDVAADMLSGMTVTWDFGDGTTNEVWRGATGSCPHIFDVAGIYTVTVTARDKDGKLSDSVSFFADVKDPAMRPTIQAVPSAARYNETNGLGSLYFTISKSYIEDVWVYLDVAYPVPSYSNLLFGTMGPFVIERGNTNSASFQFGILDGTQATMFQGITFTPVVSNTAYYSARSVRVYVDNQAPSIIKPVHSSIVGPIPSTVPYGFPFEIKDVDPDKPDMITTWDFGDSTPLLTVTGSLGRAYHTFSAAGTYAVSVVAKDKDTGLSTETEFTVQVGSAPTVTVVGPAPLYETANAGGVKDYIIVRLSTAYTNAVTVNLTVSPPNSPLNGTLTLDKTQVIFPAGNIGEVKEQIVTISNIKDGTDISANTGFTITPSVVATPASQAFYGSNMEPGEVRILNVAPVLDNPPANDITATIPSIIIAQNADRTFYWSVTDVLKDCTNNYMKVTWYWNDGTAPTVVYGNKSGWVTHNFSAIGDVTIQVFAEDKDGGVSLPVFFKIRVSAAKSVDVTPVGPASGGGVYAGALGLGNGLIFSDDAINRVIQQDVYSFKYDPGVNSAGLIAVPYKTGGVSSNYRLTNYINRVTGLPGSTALGTPNGYIPYDSFFYVWLGTEQGIPDDWLVPIASPSVRVELPTTVSTGTAGATTSVDTRQVLAVFSREYLATDNAGDINADGIPDRLAILYGLPALLGSDLTSAMGYNGDLDYLPGAASDGGGLIGGASNVWAVVGRPFTAFLEVRGYHEGLNNPTFGSDPYYGPGEQAVFDEYGVSSERPTDPTNMDTDGDGYPDGWEYFFWYQALVNKLTGLRYNPFDVANGTLLDWPEIYDKFDPLRPATDPVTARDLDNDGLLDYEELATGTNPINWDSDDDGMCDGWEVLRGLNPNDARDALDATRNNLDGDYMAIATVNRELVTITDAGGAVVGTYLRDAEGNVTTWYNYGSSNAPIAVGRPVELPAGDETSEPVEALILHFQVYHELGFDPRTAWTDVVNPANFTTRFPGAIGGAAPNTKPFTALDEYLLMKFMSENRLNGATASIGAGNMNNKTLQWSAFSTHPLTPDNDETPANIDGMPDGWELYIACAPDTRDMVINPWNPLDGGARVDDDDLVNSREFAGTDSSYKYNNIALYRVGATPRITITRPAGDAKWLNKFWPTDPWNLDTDGDGLMDSQEAATQVASMQLINGLFFIFQTTLQYGAGVDNGKPCIRGAGLNPCTMDTDWDALTDTWEYDFAGTNSVSGVTRNPYIDDGMDGTHGPGLDLPAAMGYGDAFDAPDAWVTGSAGLVRRMDFDRDGLQNYQEYWSQAMRHFRYDFTDDQIPMDGSMGPDVFFTPITNPWDYAAGSFWFPMLGESVLLRPGLTYISADPREPDTDFDGMDDYYEMFHGLNPLASEYVDVVGTAYMGMISAKFNGWNANPDEPLPMDFMTYPWLAGLDEADPDADGLRNLEEQIQPDTAPPLCANTDPSPIWMTDSSSAVSLTYRFYGLLGMFFWPADVMDPTFKVYSFEMNEGYDTDNDGVCDKSEKMHTTTSLSDPQDHDDPLRRQAIWFGGFNSAAQTLIGYSYNEWAFRSFTVELWARPDVVLKEQVLLERAVVYGPSDLSTTGDVVRANFRIGINGADGRVYAMFQNAGVHDDHTGQVKAYGRILSPGKWVHISARMDGAGNLDLFIDGRVETSLSTTLIPANGVVNVLADPDNAQYPVPYEIWINPGLLVVGAQNTNPYPDPEIGPVWTDYTNFFQGYMDEVRVWDGARSNTEILDNYAKRFTKLDLLENRLGVADSVNQGGSRIVGAVPQLPAELMYHYTFDNLFSADGAYSVAKAPRGFNFNQVTVNRPEGYVVDWWSTLNTANDVYTDYGYIPWIENGIQHLPLATGEVLNSKYWAHQLAGEIPTLPTNHPLSTVSLDQYSFPDNNNPYGFWYRTALLMYTLDSAGEQIGSDLLPLGNAWAKQVPEMWDDASPSSIWAENGEDSDADGLPNWMEDGVIGAAVGWYDLIAGDDTSTYGELYLRFLAAGMTAANNPFTNPGGWTAVGVDSDGDGAVNYINWVAAAGNNVIKQTADIDNDGLPDWWENIYNLKVNSALGDNGSRGDPDLDGLSNYAEYMISEKYPFGRVLRPNRFRSSPKQTTSDYFLKQGLLYYGQMFSDHDLMEDVWEDNYDPYFVNRFVYDSHLDNDDDGWSNWAESRYAAFSVKSDPSLNGHLNIYGDVIPDFPVPVVQAKMSYSGIQQGGNLVLQAFSTPTMDGPPTATYNVEYVPTPDQLLDNNTAQGSNYRKYIGLCTDRQQVGTLSPGSIIPGTVEIRFTDIGADTTKIPAYWDWWWWWYYWYWDPFVVPPGVTAVQTYNNTIAGYDVVNDVMNRTGVLRAQDSTGVMSEIGTINYVTGEFTLDLSWFTGRTLAGGINPAGSIVEILYYPRQLNLWPKTLYLSDANQGYLRGGTNYFFAFMDLDNSGDWTVGEPSGVTTPFATDIGWHKNEISIELTDYTPNYLRLSLASGMRSEDVYFGTSSGTLGGGGGVAAGLTRRVRVVRKLVDGVTTYRRIVFDKLVRTPRDFLHEGDLLGMETNVNYALDWGFVGVPVAQARSTVVYEVYTGDQPDAALTNFPVSVFTNTYSVSRAKAVATEPINGAYVYASRPVFKWSMPKEYTAFTLEITKGATLIYSSGTVQRPASDSYGNCVWEAPICAGARLPTGQIFAPNTVYSWRVMAMNAKFSDTVNNINWSDTKYFRLDVSVPMESSGYGAVNARVKYYGPAKSLLSNRVKVQAYKNAAFTGYPEAEYTLAAADLNVMTSSVELSVNAILKGLARSSVAGDYYVCAFIDHNANGIRDAWESWGYANYYGLSGYSAHDPRPVKVDQVPRSETVDITIEDADTDQDWFPDGWEYERNPSGDFLGATSASSDTNNYTEVNPFLSTGSDLGYEALFMSMAVETGDADQDGLGDLVELVLGSNADSASTSGDGYLDGDKIRLGLSPADTLSLSLTGLDVADPSAPALKWSVGVDLAEGVSRSLYSAYAPAGQVGYEVLYKPTLAAPQWEVVKTGSVTLSGVQALVSDIQASVMTDPAQGFFKVRLVAP